MSIARPSQPRQVPRLDDLPAQADVVSLHVPETAGTQGMTGRQVAGKLVLYSDNATLRSRILF